MRFNIYYFAEKQAKENLKRTISTSMAVGTNILERHMTSIQVIGYPRVKRGSRGEFNGSNQKKNNKNQGGGEVPDNSVGKEFACNAGDPVRSLCWEKG